MALQFAVDVTESESATVPAQGRLARWKAWLRGSATRGYLKTGPERAVRVAERKINPARAVGKSLTWMIVAAVSVVVVVVVVLVVVTQVGAAATEETAEATTTEAEVATPAAAEASTDSETIVITPTPASTDNVTIILTPTPASAEDNITITLPAPTASGASASVNLTLSSQRCDNTCVAAQNGYCQDGGVGDYGGAIGGFCEWGTDCEDCIPRDHPSPPSPPELPPELPPPPSPQAPPLPPHDCVDACPLVASGHCEDGGPGSIQGVMTASGALPDFCADASVYPNAPYCCEYGTDCGDCGKREILT